MICFAARTDIGQKRTTNEDFFAVDEARGLFLVADGLGGHVGGRTASEIASYRFCDALSQLRELPPLEAVRRAYCEAHAAIRERIAREPGLSGMGTTLVSLWLRERSALLGHVGDSRIYLLRAGRLHLLTRDHSLVSEMVIRGQLTPQGARLHPHRHVITRALGVSAPMEPDTAELRLEPGDLFALCSDGICTPLDDDELREQLETTKGDLAIAADALISLANQRGGDDNATIVLVHVG